MALHTTATIHIKSKYSRSATNPQPFTTLRRHAGIIGCRYAVTLPFSLRTFFRRVYLYMCVDIRYGPNPQGHMDKRT